jgi:hypothetical protein
MPIDLIPRLFTAFNERDEKTLYELTDPEIVWDAPTAALAGREGPYRGHEGLHDYLEDVDRLWVELRALPIQVRMRGEEIFAVGRLYARGVRLGIRDLPVAWSLTLRNRRCVMGQVHEDPRRAALEAGWLKPTGQRQPG